MILGNRILGVHQGPAKGPLLLAFGGIHGNEPAGVKALQKVFQMIEAEYETNPSFHFKGRMVGIAGNLLALKQEVRFIDRDLNRLWLEEVIQNKFDNPSFPEIEELQAVLKIVKEEIDQYQPQEIVVLDLHTTTAKGGIFIIPGPSPLSLKLAQEFPVPNLLGALERTTGSTLHYFNSENLGISTRSILFESGQHEDPLSIDRAIAAIIHCLKIIGCVAHRDVDNRHLQLLISYSRDLPQVCQIIEVHSIQESDGFVMIPGFKNFHPVQKGTLLANDKNGPIYAKENGYILMPHYQKQGEDGFYLVKVLTSML